MAQRDSDERTQKVQWIFDAECEEYRERLYQLATAKQRGLPVAEDFADVLAHCATCQSCQHLYDELVYMLEVEATEGLMDAEEIAAINVPIPTDITGVDALVETVQRGVDWLLQQTADGYQLLLELTNITAGLQPGMATRREPDQHDMESALGAMTVDTIEIEQYQDAVIKALVLANASNPDSVIVQAEIELPSRWPADFSGIEVALHGSSEAVRRQVTGPNGIVRFTDIPRSELAEISVTVELPVT